uniref:Uncharacterized protein n=1 Tax=Tanacetum cinerariifolium TaxID=118510 RepID=A0A6L2K4K1_TANCI|nr:hypothetical protein [Tanacetum cinerariifolium]
MSETSIDNNTSCFVFQRQKASDYDNSGPAPQLKNISPSADTTALSKQESKHVIPATSGHHTAAYTTIVIISLPRYLSTKFTISPPPPHHRRPTFAAPLVAAIISTSSSLRHHHLRPTSSPPSPHHPVSTNTTATTSPPSSSSSAVNHHDHHRGSAANRNNHFTIYFRVWMNLKTSLELPHLILKAITFAVTKSCDHELFMKLTDLGALELMDLIHARTNKCVQYSTAYRISSLTSSSHLLTFDLGMLFFEMSSLFGFIHFYHLVTLSTHTYLPSIFSGAVTYSLARFRPLQATTPSPTPPSSSSPHPAAFPPRSPSPRHRLTTVDPPSQPHQPLPSSSCHHHLRPIPSPSSPHHLVSTNTIATTSPPSSSSSTVNHHDHHRGSAANQNHHFTMYF